MWVLVLFANYMMGDTSKGVKPFVSLANIRFGCKTMYMKNY